MKGIERFPNSTFDLEENKNVISQTISRDIPKYNRILSERMLHKNDIVGDYRLDKFLGRGQFGEVWLADKNLKFSNKKIRHALKFLINRVGEEQDLKQVQDEIDTWIEACGHPNVISVLDMLVYQGHVVIVSEYADGGSLKDWLKLNGGKAPTEAKAVELMLGILRGVEHLHSKNVVHRDLKPENILLQGDFPRITDFGISRIVSDKTTTTQAIGSPSYMSPESFLGNKSAQTDVWSAGVILYELLSGELPFDGANIFLLKEAIEKASPQPLPVFVSDELKEIVRRALEKDKSRRVATAREMRLALETASYSLRKFSSEKTIADDQPLFDTHLPQSTVSLNRTENNNPKNPSPTEAVNFTSNNISQSGKTQPSSGKKFDAANRNVVDKRHSLENQDDKPRTVIEPLRFDLPVAQQQKPKVTSTKLWIVGLLASIIIGLSIGIFLAVRSANEIAADTDNRVQEKTVISSQNKAEPINSPKGMAYIPGGEFTMGRADGKSEAEKPAFKTSVKPFFMDLTEVTNEQYAAFLKKENYKAPAEWKNANFPEKQNNFPVVGVNWQDANAFCQNEEKRLPTETEWEFAARGPENFIYPWGNEWNPDNANAGGSSEKFSEVGKYAGGKSPFGILDMVGNAWEWTASDFKAFPNGVLPPAFAGKANLKTIRGGSFESTKDFATTTYRIGWAPSGAQSYNRVGFRCAKGIK